MSPVGILKAAALALTDEGARKKLGWIIVAILSPVIVVLALIASAGTGTAEHNNFAVRAVFYGSAFGESIPEEYRIHISDMRSAFSLLEREVTLVNEDAEGGGIDPVQVKAAFFSLCFGEDVPSGRNAHRFVRCFYRREARTTEEGESYSVNVPLPFDAACVNLASEIGREVTEDDKENITHIYQIVCGSAYGDESRTGGYQIGGNPTASLEGLELEDTERKTASDLARYAVHAWESGWGYIAGTYGQVLTESLLEYKVSQYPDGVGKYEDLIRLKWLGRRTADCIGLIKGYCWLDPETLAIGYAVNGMPDLGVNELFYSAAVSGPIDTIPEKAGIAVWVDGHVGIYIGGDEVIEAANTGKGVIKTHLSRRNFTHWFEIPCLSYD